MLMSISIYSLHTRLYTQYQDRTAPPTRPTSLHRLISYTVHIYQWTLPKHKSLLNPSHSKSPSLPERERREAPPSYPKGSATGERMRVPCAQPRRRSPHPSMPMTLILERRCGVKARARKRRDPLGPRLPWALVSRLAVLGDRSPL